MALRMIEKSVDTKDKASKNVRLYYSLIAQHAHSYLATSQLR